MSCKTQQSLCPLCQKPNHCGVSAPGGCWCGGVEIPMELIDLLPERGKYCICQGCVESYHADPAGFAGITRTDPL